MPADPLSTAEGSPVDLALQELIDSHPDQIALLDEDWKILAVSRDWEKEATAHGFAEFRIGGDYLAILKRGVAEGDRDSSMILSAVRQVASGRRRRFQLFYTPGGMSPERCFKFSVTRFESGGKHMAMLSRCEVTELFSLTKKVRRLESSLLTVQEEERRRIGRDLHDSTAQLLVALQLSLIRMKGLHEDRASIRAFREMDETLKALHHEIRAVSYLLHPPPLEHGRLVEALKSMSRGFARRSQLSIAVGFDGDVRAWPEAVEGTLYRLAQEALANVHRHAHALKVRIRLASRRSGHLHLIVDDDGIGISDEAAQSPAPFGVGLAGMRERIEELGGRFSVRRYEHGTCLVATIPPGAGREEAASAAQPGSLDEADRKLRKNGAGSGNRTRITSLEGTRPG